MLMVLITDTFYVQSAVRSKTVAYTKISASKKSKRKRREIDQNIIIIWFVLLFFIFISLVLFLYKRASQDRFIIHYF